MRSCATRREEFIRIRAETRRQDLCIESRVIVVASWKLNERSLGEHRAGEKEEKKEEKKEEEVEEEEGRKGKKKSKRVKYLIVQGNLSRENSREQPRRNQGGKGTVALIPGSPETRRRVAAHPCGR